MLYVGYVLEKRLDVSAIIDNVVTDLIRMCVFGSALYHCHNWREGFVPLYCVHLQLSTVWRAPAVPSDTAGLCDVCAILI